MIRIQDLCKNYQKGPVVIHAIKNLSLEVSPGEFCALMGPSGSGKSSLLNMVAGLDVPTSGEIFLDGHSTKGFKDKDWTNIRREVLGMIFQAFHLVPGLTAGENVALPLRFRGGFVGSIKSRVEECLNMVGMQNRAHHRPSELSGGEQQRVAIARAFVHHPKIILADEPTGNLDSQRAKEIVTLLREVSSFQGQAVVLVTHSDMASEVADRRYIMQDGQLQLFSHNP